MSNKDYVFSSSSDESVDAKDDEDYDPSNQPLTLEEETKGAWKSNKRKKGGKDQCHQSISIAKVNAPVTKLARFSSHRKKPYTSNNSRSMINTNVGDEDAKPKSRPDSEIIEVRSLLFLIILFFTCCFLNYSLSHLLF